MNLYAEGALHAHVDRAARTGRWWRYAVLRSSELPIRPELNGLWIDLDESPPPPYDLLQGTAFVATDRWENRDDGEVAVVYVPQRAL